MKDEREENIEGLILYLANKAYVKYKEMFPFEDILDMAHKGLNYAVKYYNPDKPAKWPTFVTMVVKQRIETEINRKKYSKMILNRVEVDGLKKWEHPVEDAYNKEQESKEYLNWLLKNSGLSKNEHTALSYRLEGLVYAEIGKILRVSTERVRQIIGAARRKLKYTHTQEMYA